MLLNNPRPINIQKEDGYLLSLWTSYLKPRIASWIKLPLRLHLFDPLWSQIMNGISPNCSTIYFLKFITSQTSVLGHTNHLLHLPTYWAEKNMIKVANNYFIFWCLKILNMQNLSSFHGILNFSSEVPAY